MKKTLIIGATTNPERYAYKAAHSLVSHGHEIVPIGVDEGEVAGHKILKSNILYKDIDTVTLYINPRRQPPLYDYILKTNPKRIVFNPGTENRELEELAQKNGIETLEACTLVMLGIGNY